MKKLSVLPILVVVTALLAAACDGGPTPAPDSRQLAASGSARATGAPDKPPPLAQPMDKPADNQLSAGSQAADLVELKDVTEGLNSLGSYESTFTLAFKGPQGGPPADWTWTLNEQVVKNPPARRSIMLGLGTAMVARGTDSTGQASIEFVDVGGKTYSRLGDLCASPAYTEAFTGYTRFMPSNVIGGIKTARLLGADNINGVSTQHYAVDISDLNLTALGAYANGQSEVWIAQPGNLVVKYSFEATGTDAILGSGSNPEGTLKWVYELKNVNQPIVIEAPKDCHAP